MAKQDLLGMVFFGLIILGVFLVLATNIPESSIIPSEQKYDLTCRVEIENLIFSEMKIKQIIGCTTKKSTLFSLSSNFALFSDSGNLIMDAQDKSVTQGVKVGEGKSNQYTMELRKLEARQTTVTFTLLDEGNKKVDTKSLTLNIGG